MYLFFDTETTGLPSRDFKPRIVQLAAILTDEQGEELDTINTLIKPDGWTVPEELVAIHGKTTEMCESEGRPMPEVLAEFNELKAKAKMRVAHNLRFDKIMMAIEAEFYGIPHDSSELESFCTMEQSKNILKIPPSDKMKARGMRSFKPPRLQEAYVFFHGKPFDGAHDALADVRACRDVFFKLKGFEPKPRPMHLIKPRRSHAMRD